MSAKWNAATRYSAHPFTTKTGARVHFFCLNYPRIWGWYQARVHPFSSGNGKGDTNGISIQKKKNCPLCFLMFSHAFLFMLFCSNHQPKKEEKTLGKIHISSSNHQPSVFKSSQNTGGKKNEKIPKHCPCCSWIPAPWSRPFSIGSSAAVPLTTARSRSAPAAACPPQNCPRKGPESWVKSCRNPQLENWNTELEDLLICDMDFYRLTMVNIIFTYTYIYIYVCVCVILDKSHSSYAMICS